jgi:hypothetical protein
MWFVAMRLTVESQRLSAGAHTAINVTSANGSSSSLRNGARAGALAEIVSGTLEDPGMQGLLQKRLAIRRQGTAPVQAYLKGR